MHLTHALSVLLAALTLAIVASAASNSSAQVASDTVGDPERGRVVFRSIGYCVNCKGGAGEGK
jgi:cytochrome c